MQKYQKNHTILTILLKWYLNLIIGSVTYTYSMNYLKKSSEHNRSEVVQK